MTIAEARQKCKTWIEWVPRDVLVVGILVLSASASFGLGYQAGRDAAGQGSMTIEVTGPVTDTAQAGLPAEAGAKAGEYVASKNGTKYYLTTCSGAARISEANKIWFVSAAAARGAGYAPAANCPGL